MPGKQSESVRDQFILWVDMPVNWTRDHAHPALKCNVAQCNGFNVQCLGIFRLVHHYDLFRRRFFMDFDSFRNGFIL